MLIIKEAKLQGIRINTNTIYYIDKLYIAKIKGPIFYY